MTVIFFLMKNLHLLDTIQTLWYLKNGQIFLQFMKILRFLFKKLVTILIMLFKALKII